VLGLTAERRISAGVSEVDIIVPGRRIDTAERLRTLGWPATTFAADGPSGPVTLICIAVDDSVLAELTAAVRQVAPTPSGLSNASALPTHPCSPTDTCRSPARAARRDGRETAAARQGARSREP
jgi:hypothetical protein